MLHSCSAVTTSLLLLDLVNQNSAWLSIRTSISSSPANTFRTMPAPTTKSSIGDMRLESSLARTTRDLASIWMQCTGCTMSRCSTLSSCGLSSEDSYSSLFGVGSSDRSGRASGMRSKHSCTEVAGSYRRQAEDICYQRATPSSFQALRDYRCSY